MSDAKLHVKAKFSEFKPKWRWQKPNFNLRILIISFIFGCLLSQVDMNRYITPISFHSNTSSWDGEGRETTPWTCNDVKFYGGNCKVSWCISSWTKKWQLLNTVLPTIYNHVSNIHYIIEWNHFTCFHAIQPLIMI